MTDTTAPEASDGLVTQLRDWAREWDGTTDAGLCSSAADRIDALEAANAKLDDGIWEIAREKARVQLLNDELEAERDTLKAKVAELTGKAMRDPLRGEIVRLEHNAAIDKARIAELEEALHEIAENPRPHKPFGPERAHCAYIARKALEPQP